MGWARRPQAWSEVANRRTVRINGEDMLPASPGPAKTQNAGSEARRPQASDEEFARGCDQRGSVRGGAEDQPKGMSQKARVPCGPVDCKASRHSNLFSNVSARLEGHHRHDSEARPGIASVLKVTVIYDDDDRAELSLGRGARCVDRLTCDDGGCMREIDCCPSVRTHFHCPIFEADAVNTATRSSWNLSTWPNG